MSLFGLNSVQISDTTDLDCMAEALGCTCSFNLCCTRRSAANNFIGKYSEQINERQQQQGSSCSPQPGSAGSLILLKGSSSSPLSPNHWSNFGVFCLLNWCCEVNVNVKWTMLNWLIRCCLVGLLVLSQCALNISGWFYSVELNRKQMTSTASFTLALNRRSQVITWQADVKLSSNI